MLSKFQYKDGGPSQRALPEDEQIYQEEMITQMLSSIQSKDINKNVVALREEGKVLVFKT